MCVNVNALPFKDREFTGKVVEIVNGDALMVKAGGKFRKIFLASIRLAFKIVQRKLLKLYFKEQPPFFILHIFSKLDLMHCAQ